MKDNYINHSHAVTEIKPSTENKSRVGLKLVGPLPHNMYSQLC